MISAVRVKVSPSLSTAPPLPALFPETVLLATPTVLPLL
jgi:hypothetical protein